ncbi:MAG: patatin-like phospholipase family protein [Betaproteobacteria bacterium]|nr:patatin-like phospholipase family protein [Betaproteobacteria bacterium]
MNSRLLVILFSLGCALGANAAPGPDPAASPAAANGAAAPVKARPKVGLVLSGGGARGAAHIGVIKVLEELRVPIDFIAGSSMGALVGAAYASGTPVKELEQDLLSQDWDRLLTDESPRVDRSFLRKEEDQNRLLRLELGVKRDGIRLPPGAITGQKFDALFSQITRNAPPTQDFDQLPIPFRAVATDAESGTMHVFADGRLVDAMRASMSVPGAIAPYQVGERIYLDGGLTRNLPVDVARKMGADVVIVVNIGTPLLKKQDIQSLVGVSLQMVNILTEQNVRASIDSLNKTDHLLSPPLDTIGATDFKLVGDAINIGAATARANAQALSVLSLPADAYAAFRQLQLARAPAPIGDRDHLADVRVTGLERASAEELKRTLGVKPGDPLDFRKLNLGVSRVFGSGYFERVNYSLLNDSGRNVLAIDAREKSWGPNYLRFGLSLNADTVGEGRFNLLMRYLQTQFNSWGAEWRTDFQLGRDRRVATQFFQPLGASGWRNALSVSLGAEAVRRPLDFYQNDVRFTQFLLTANSKAIDLGLDLSRNMVLRIGVVDSSNVTQQNIGIATFADPRSRDNGARARFLYDDLDDASFPREGRLLQLDYYAALDGLGASEKFRRAEGNFQQHLSSGNNTASIALRYGRGYDGTINLFNRFSLGGFLQLSGFRPGELLGTNVAFARASYQRRLTDFQNVFGKNLYAGFSTEFGKIADTPEALRASDVRRSATLYLGMETVLGPFYIGYGKAKDRGSIFYLFLGQP